MKRDKLFESFLKADSDTVHEDMYDRAIKLYEEREPASWSDNVDTIVEFTKNEIHLDRLELIKCLEQIASGSLSKIQVAHRLDNFIAMAKEFNK